MEGLSSIFIDCIALAKQGDNGIGSVYREKWGSIKPKDPPSDGLTQQMPNRQDHNSTFLHNVKRGYSGGGGYFGRISEKMFSDALNVSSQMNLTAYFVLLTKIMGS